MLRIRHSRTPGLVLVPSRWLPTACDPRRAFTLVELLVVIAIIALLAALLLPVLSVAKSKGQLIGCLNNLKQLSLAWQMYAADNSSVLVFNSPATGQATPVVTNVWVAGNMQNPLDSTNTALIRRGKLFPYASQVPLYHCPADSSRTAGVRRVRSYSMNSWMGSRYMETAQYASPYRTFLKENEITTAGPAGLWVMTDEHEVSIDDCFFLVTMNDSQPFVSFPATRHRRAGNLNFADGHAESFRLRDPMTPETPGKQGSLISSTNSDWARFKRITTSSWGGRYQ